MNEKYITTNTTALELIRLHRETPGGILFPAVNDNTPIKPSAPSHLEWKRTEIALRTLGCQPPFHVIVTDRKDRRTARFARTHYVKYQPNATELHQATESLYVCSPEFCLLQLASQLNEIQLLGLAFEMCGYYTRNECGKSNPHKLEPISNPEQILAFLESAKSFHGVKPLRRIVDYVLPYSRSIKETQLALQLCLPNHLHGFALPKPQLNYRIDIPFAERAMLGADSYTVDFCWPKYRLAMEYDSEAFHGESNRKADAKRRNGLRYLGYLVIESNASDLRTTFDASRLAERLAALMKLKAKPGQFDVTAEKIKTHGQIMGLSTFP